MNIHYQILLSYVAMKWEMFSVEIREWVINISSSM